MPKRLLLWWFQRLVTMDRKCTGQKRARDFYLGGMMSEWTIYHHPRCSKSRGALEILRERGIVPQVIEYCQQPLTQDELRRLIIRLGLTAKEIIRTKEEKVSQLNLNFNDQEAVIQALANYPELMERPIVVHGERAVVARPPEIVLTLL